MAMRPPMPSMILSRRAKIVLVGRRRPDRAADPAGEVVRRLHQLPVVRRGRSPQRLQHDALDRSTLFFIFGVLMALIIGAQHGGRLPAAAAVPADVARAAEPAELRADGRAAAQADPRPRSWCIALLAAGASAQGDWQTWQLWLNGGSFGVEGPAVPPRHLASTPGTTRSTGCCSASASPRDLLAAARRSAIHYLSGAIRLQTPGPKITIAARRHLTVLVFVFMVLKAVAYWLDRYGFVFSNRSKFTGASYTDVHSALPAKTILFWITILLALGVLASIWLRSAAAAGHRLRRAARAEHPDQRHLPGDRAAGVGQAERQRQGSALHRAQHRGDPRRRTTSSRSDKATRRHGELPSVPGRREPDADRGRPTPTRRSTTSASSTRTSIAPTVHQRSRRSRQPYGFPAKLDVDRYTIDGAEHDYIVGVRELVAGQPDRARRTTGSTSTPSTRTATDSSRPRPTRTSPTANADYTEGDIPPTGPLDIKPAAASTSASWLNDYSIVGAKGGKPREYDGNGDEHVTYAGKGGVSLSNPFTKLAFAVNYKETNFLLNDAVGASGREDHLQPRPEDAGRRRSRRS